MREQINESQIFWENANQAEIDLGKYYRRFGKRVAKALINNYSKRRSYTVVCGLGGNAADGLATSIELLNNGVTDLSVYVVGRTNKFKDPFAETLYRELNQVIEDASIKAKYGRDWKSGKGKIELKGDAYAKDIKKTDIIVEALCGTGLEGDKLNKRFRDVVKRISHFGSKIAAIDKPTPHYTPDKTYSLLYAKTEDAEVFKFKDIGFDDIPFGPGEYKALWQPNKVTHKKKNGHVFYIAQKNKLLPQVKKSANSYYANLSSYSFGDHNGRINVTTDKLEDTFREVDSVLIGNLDDQIVNRGFLEYLVDSSEGEVGQPRLLAKNHVIFFGTSVDLLNKNLVSNLAGALLIIDASQISDLLGEKVNLTGMHVKLRRFAVLNRINIILTGTQVTLISAGGQMKFRHSKIQFNEKATAELAGLVASYMSKNDTWLSMRAGVYRFLETR